VYDDINGVPHNDAPLPNLSKRNLNAALLYDYKIWSARLAYNWRSEYLLSTNAGGSNGDYTYYSASTPSSANCLNAPTCQHIKISLPVFASAYGQLDLGLTLRPSEHWYVELEAANLTNSLVKSTFGGYPGGQYTKVLFVSDRHYTLSAGFKF
jgi:outer membrane receptor protein involved in Fe transport